MNYRNLRSICKAALSYFALAGLTVCVAWAAGPTAESSARSEWVYYGKDGKLEYKTTEAGDRIMDFSHAGYMGGGVALPDVPVKITIGPKSDPGEDCTEMIRQAIERVSALPPDSDGFRGAVLLLPGVYPTSAPVTIETDGVVLKGSGKGENGTVITMSGPKYTAFVLNSQPRGRDASVDARESGGIRTKVTDDYIPAGSDSFTVADASGLMPSDEIRISKPVTAQWVEFLNMHDLVRDGKPQTWIREGNMLSVVRRIKSVDGNRITLEVPLVDSYDKRFTGDGTTVAKAPVSRLLKKAGVENLRIVSTPQAVNHGQALYYGVSLVGEDCWLRDIDLIETMESVRMGGRRLTISNVAVTREALHQGASKPSEFSPNGTQILMDRCAVKGDNIWFVALGGGHTGPIVLLNCGFFQVTVA